ncbi:GNAT family N-acetyltransferase [Fusibacter bizertensis]|uniref:GNAT family N-acetyltransferase n=1 Tax=Fusibacter bizertensis TaxID=1488331 RepID=A0ABT6N8P8_9FIRM|nr:GNAT family N-acetyltransferase [Fusibacter bizertensis]MDH8676782.1 GNAT family N-acetyltransferase [Fusibacter bizertensis]
MMIDKKKLGYEIDRVSKEWDASGGFVVIKDGEVLYDQVYGFADRENGILTTRESNYIMDTETSVFLGLCTFLLIDQGKIKLEDKIDMYIPEYQFADKIQIKHLLKNATGIPDFFYTQLMIKLDKDRAHQALSHCDKIRAENKLRNQNKNYKDVLSLIGDQPLEYEPGTIGRNGSESNSAFLAEIVRRVTHMTVFEFLVKHVFTPLNMTGVNQGQASNTTSYTVYRHNNLVRMPLDYQVDGLFTLTLEDVKKLLMAIGEAKVISKKMWKQALKPDSEGNGLIFENANGFDCVSMLFNGYGLCIYFNHKTGISYVSLVNEEQKFKNIEGIWYYYRKCLREVIEATFTYPLETKMAKISSDNLWDALNIKVDPEQLEFVLEAKSSIAMALMYKTKKAFVQMEGKRVIGLLVLDIDKKNKHYNIDIIQIDKRFQGRGYGKLMIKWAVEYLAKEGAKELEIGVSRFNHAAQKVYMDAGFSAKSIYEESMTLHLSL